MNGFLGNFFEHGGQIVSLATTAAVWLGLSVLGTALATALDARTGAAADRHPEAGVLYGWAIVSFGFTVMGVLTPLPFTVPAAACALAALAAGAWLARRGGAIVAPGLLRMMVLTAPLLLLVSAMAGSQWDEFSDWLASPRQILVIDTFPDDSNKHWGGSLAAYPYGWHFITYLTSRLAGRLIENAGALVNVLLLLSFALAVLRLFRDGRGDTPEAPGATAPGWGLSALAALAVLATFPQKVALTSYADVATGVCVGFAGVLGWRMLAALAEGRAADARGLALRIGLIMLVLVNLKQATVVLFVLVVGAIVLAGLRDPAIRPGALAARLPAMVVPGIVIYVVWRIHVAAALTGAEMAVQPFDAWLIGQMGEILLNMVIVLSKKGAYLALMTVATLFALAALLRLRTAFDRLAIITGAMFVGYNAFLFFVYVTTFGPLDGPRVASLWRYNMHLGPLGVAFAAHGLGILWRRRFQDQAWPRRVAWVPVVAIIALPFVFTDKLRFDRHPNVPHFRAVGAEVAAMLAPTDTLYVIDPKGSGESGVIARFEIGISRTYQGYLSIFHPATAETFRELLLRRGYSHVLVHSTAPALIATLGVALDDGTSYLLGRDGRGGWRVVKAWPYPGRH